MNLRPKAWRQTRAPVGGIDAITVGVLAGSDDTTTATTEGETENGGIAGTTTTVTETATVIAAATDIDPSKRTTTGDDRSPDLGADIATKTRDAPGTAGQIAATRQLNADAPPSVKWVAMTMIVDIKIRRNRLGLSLVLICVMHVRKTSHTGRRHSRYLFDDLIYIQNSLTHNSS